MHCPGGNATDAIWRVLASSDRISSRTPLKPQHNNPNPNPLANQLCCIDSLTPPIPLIIPHRLPAFPESLMPLKNSCSIHARCSIHMHIYTNIHAYTYIHSKSINKKDKKKMIITLPTPNKTWKFLLEQRNISCSIFLFPSSSYLPETFFFFDKKPLNRN